MRQCVPLERHATFMPASDSGIPGVPLSVAAVPYASMTYIKLGRRARE